MIESRFVISHITRISLNAQVISSLTIFKIEFLSMVKDVKVASLPIEYCAFMVAIMITRFKLDSQMPNVQQSAEKVAEKLNSLEFGQKGNYFVVPAALHHGLFLFKRALESLGFEIIEMNGKEKQLVDWSTLSGGKRGYEVKFPHFDAVSLAPEYTEISLNDAILTNRDLLLFKANFTKSSYLSCSSLFLDLFVDIKNVVKNEGSFLSPTTEAVISTFKVRKPIDELSERSIKNNGKRILEYVENFYGIEDAELYITAAYDLVVKKNRKNGTPETRILPFLEHEREKKELKYDEELFENDMRVVNALQKIKKKNVTMSVEEKFQILTVFDAVRAVLSEIDISDIDNETAIATFKLIQSYNGLCNISLRSIVRLNTCRDMILKQRGKKIDLDFESEVWGNLMLCYYETGHNEVNIKTDIYIIYK